MKKIYILIRNFFIAWGEYRYEQSRKHQYRWYY